MLSNFFKITDDQIKDVKIEYNFHTHNYLCGHAIGNVEDYVEKAVENNIKVMGISDHIATYNWEKSAYGINLQNIDDLYISQIDIAQKKYIDKISILKGGEVEFYDECLESYKELKTKLDYLILGQHCVKIRDSIVGVSCLEDNEDFAIKLLEAEMRGIDSGCFSILAHPDMVFGWYKGPREKLNKLFEELILKAVSKNILIEFNANGIRNNGFGYPTDLLVNICKYYDISVIVSSDCHSPDALADSCVKKLIYYLINKGIKILSLKEIKGLYLGRSL